METPGDTNDSGYNAPQMHATLTITDDAGTLALRTEYHPAFDARSPAHQAAQALMAHMDTIAEPVIDPDELEIVIATVGPQ